MKTQTQLPTTVLALGLSAIASPVCALEIALSPVKFNTVYEDNPTYASGVSTSLFIGPIASGSPRRILLQFDLASLPAGASVTAASLSFNVNRAARFSDSTDNLAIHRLLASWGQGTTDGGSGGGGNQASAGDATWNARFYNAPPATPSVLWTTPGGDFLSTASFSGPMGVAIGPVLIPSTPGLLADVNHWLANPGDNHGWIAIGAEGPGLEYKARRVDTIVLNLTYELAPTAVPAFGPIALMLAALGLAGLGFCRSGRY